MVIRILLNPKSVDMEGVTTLAQAQAANEQLKQGIDELNRQESEARAQEEEAERRRGGRRKRRGRKYEPAGETVEGDIDRMSMDESAVPQQPTPEQPEPEDAEYDFKSTRQQEMERKQAEAMDGGSRYGTVIMPEIQPEPSRMITDKSDEEKAAEEAERQRRELRKTRARVKYALLSTPLPSRYGVIQIWPEDVLKLPPPPADPAERLDPKAKKDWNWAEHLSTLAYRQEQEYQRLKADPHALTEDKLKALTNAQKLYESAAIYAKKSGMKDAAKILDAAANRLDSEVKSKFLEPEKQRKKNKREYKEQIKTLQGEFDAVMENAKPRLEDDERSRAWNRMVLDYLMFKAEAAFAQALEKGLRKVGKKKWNAFRGPIINTVRKLANDAASPDGWLAKRLENPSVADADAIKAFIAEAFGLEPDAIPMGWTYMFDEIAKAMEEMTEGIRGYLDWNGPTPTLDLARPTAAGMSMEDASHLTEMMRTPAQPREEPQPEPTPEPEPATEPAPVEQEPVPEPAPEPTPEQPVEQEPAQPKSEWEEREDLDADLEEPFDAEETEGAWRPRESGKPGMENANGEVAYDWKEENGLLVAEEDGETISGERENFQDEADEALGNITESLPAVEGNVVYLQTNSLEPGKAPTKLVVFGESAQAIAGALDAANVTYRDNFDSIDEKMDEGKETRDGDAYDESHYKVTISGKKNVQAAIQALVGDNGDYGAVVLQDEGGSIRIMLNPKSVDMEGVTTLAQAQAANEQLKQGIEERNKQAIEAWEARTGLKYDPEWQEHTARPDGPFREKTGSTIREGTIRNGAIDGEVREYRDGVLRKTAIYKNGSETGMRKLYRGDGTLALDRFFNEDGNAVEIHYGKDGKTEEYRLVLGKRKVLFDSRNQPQEQKPETGAEGASDLAGLAGNTAMSVTIREQYDPNGWGDLGRKVNVVGDGKPFYKRPAPKGKRKTQIKDIKEEVMRLAFENVSEQPNVVMKKLDGDKNDRFFLAIDGVLHQIAKGRLFHSANSADEATIDAVTRIGDLFNASVEVPGDFGDMHYRVAAMRLDDSYFVLFTERDLGGEMEVRDVQILKSVSAKKAGAPTQVVTPRELPANAISIANLKEAWESIFLSGMEQHLKQKEAKPQPGLITIPPANTALSVGDLHTGARMAYGKPDSKFIGSGEGAQVFGWGHYSSGVKGVARDEYAMRYVKDFQKRSKVQHKGDPKSAVSIGGVVYDNVVDFAYEASRIEEALHNKLQNYERIEKDEEGNFVVGDKTVPKELLTFIAATRAALVDAQAVFSAWTGKAVPKDYRDPEFYRIARYRAKSEQDSVLPMSRFYGEMMLRGPLKSKKAWAAFVDTFFPKVERVIPEGPRPSVINQTWWTHRPNGDESHLLNWYEPLSEENWSRVLKTLEDLADEHGAKPYEMDAVFGRGWRDREVNGESAYIMVADFFRHMTESDYPEKDASEALYAHDIDGVKYPVDTFSNDDNMDGRLGWNYVAFSDEHLRVDSVEEWNPETDRFEPRPMPGNTALSVGGFGLNANARAEMEKVRKQYEGTEQWMKAPNGKPTKLNERQWLQVRTPSFKAWFGDWENDPVNASKVVDENGEPKVVGHRTSHPLGERYKKAIKSAKELANRVLKKYGFEWYDAELFEELEQFGRKYSEIDKRVPYVAEKWGIGGSSDFQVEDIASAPFENRVYRGAFAPYDVTVYTWGGERSKEKRSLAEALDNILKETTPEHFMEWAKNGGVKFIKKDPHILGSSNIEIHVKGYETLDDFSESFDWKKSFKDASNAFLEQLQYLLEFRRDYLRLKEKSKVVAENVSMPRILLSAHMSGDPEATLLHKYVFNYGSGSDNRLLWMAFKRGEPWIKNLVDKYGEDHLRDGYGPSLGLNDDVRVLLSVLRASDEEINEVEPPIAFNQDTKTNDSGWFGSGIYFYGNESRQNVGYGSNAYPVFLNIRKPVTISSISLIHDGYAEIDAQKSRYWDADRNEYSWSDLSDAEGVIVQPDNEPNRKLVADGGEYVVHNPEQIKSATDNVGTFDPNVQDIRFSVGSRPEPAPEVEPGGDVREAGEGALAWLRRKFVHAQTPVFDAVRRVMGVGREPPDALNVEAAAKNVHGKIRARQEMLQRAYLEPLKAILAQPGMDRKRFDDYALALHALERNRMIQERSVVVDPTTGEVVDLGVEAGSGVTNAWAERVIREIQRDPFAEQYKEAANILAEMNRFVLRGAVADGLLTEAQARTWMRLSPHYVPLKSGGAAPGAIHKRATGRFTRPDSVLVNSMRQAYATVRNGELNRVNKTMADWIREYDPNGEQLGGTVPESHKHAKIKMTDPQYVPKGSTAEALLRERGIRLVETEDKGGYWVDTGVLPNALKRVVRESVPQGDDIVTFWENGERKFIRLEGKRGRDGRAENEAARIADALNFKNVLHKEGRFWDAIRGLTRWKANVSTSWNPTFIVRNMGADVFNTANLMMIEGKYAELARTMRNYPEALRTIARLHSLRREAGDSKMERMFARCFCALFCW